MDKNYSYPLDYSWSTEEISSVLSFLNQVEAVYEDGTNAEDFLEAYQSYKRVVPSKSQEKQIDREFQSTSGYSSYQALQLALEQKTGRIHVRK
ncbi:UPF0223 family protein [Streptococcus sp. DD13]|uniref:UPF0223 family protein n=1 Tax=Streptococcus sp. DD13 TaxID=1777881 RepID=UPI00082CDA47|nr:UPF0223 family protein [Streptococcus sp. DD13]